ncbi:MAG TPA: ABC transporter ATP-binding protein [Candidatus Saccharimonadaceae bacterium]|jgi:putative ABC transport system ATP-binding protein|nr:ABC transporter ATP-binding protein [Candidatus Saccharimonadaceae bacterium]
MSAALRVERLVKWYPGAGAPVHAVDDMTFEVEAGTCVALMGRSGSGKSTLLHLIAGVDRPTSGRIEVAGRDLATLDDDALTRLRRTSVGLVYQFFHLMPTLSARENVALPLLLGGRARREALARADARLAEVGLEGRRDARPHTLSGGEMQRVALARALIHEPHLVLADEPTGNLDSRAAQQVLRLLRDLGARHGAAVVLVTHSAEAAAIATRVLEMRDGRIVADHAAPAVPDATDGAPAAFEGAPAIAPAAPRVP